MALNEMNFNGMNLDDNMSVGEQFNMILIYSKWMVLSNYKMHPDEIEKIQEFEFTVEKKPVRKITEMEIWSNTKRTKGYKKYSVPTHIGTALGKLVEVVEKKMKK